MSDMTDGEHALSSALSCVQGLRDENASLRAQVARWGACADTLAVALSGEIITRSMKPDTDGYSERKARAMKAIETYLEAADERARAR